MRSVYGAVVWHPLLCGEMRHHNMMADVNAYDDNGYPKVKNTLIKTKKECVEKLQKLKGECGELKPEKVRPEMTFGDWMQYWYENRCKPKIRLTAQSTYKNRIRLHIILELGQIPLNKMGLLTKSILK